MGLHLCYELHLSGDTPEADVRAMIDELHARAVVLPFQFVSPVVRVAPGDRIPPSSWSPRDITDFVRTWAAITSEPLDADGYAVRQRDDVAKAAAVGFAIRVGERCEAATFGFAAPLEADDAARARGAKGFDTWHWHFCCKTQYASLVSDEHLIRCHTSLVALLEEAARIGITIEVRDETGYWASRDTAELIRNVHEMNRTVARVAGALHDAISPAAEVHGPVIDHPEFEHLEMEKRNRKAD